MARFPGVDMIMDVARASDPVKERMALDRLAKLSEPGASSQSFARALSDVENKRPSGTPAPSGTSTLLKVSDSGTPTAAKAAKQFEAFILQTFIEQMLPEEKTGLFGDQIAGGVWRSLMAEKLASAIASGRGVGIAALLTKQLSRNEPAAAQEPGQSAGSSTPPKV